MSDSDKDVAPPPGPPPPPAAVTAGAITSTSTDHPTLSGTSSHVAIITQGSASGRKSESDDDVKPPAGPAPTSQTISVATATSASATSGGDEDVKPPSMPPPPSTGTIRADTTIKIEDIPALDQEYREARQRVRGLMIITFGFALIVGMVILVVLG